MEDKARVGAKRDSDVEDTSSNFLSARSRNSTTIKLAWPSTDKIAVFDRGGQV